MSQTLVMLSINEGPSPVETKRHKKYPILAKRKRCLQQGISTVTTLLQTLHLSKRKAKIWNVGAFYTAFLLWQLLIFMLNWTVGIWHRGISRKGLSQCSLLSPGPTLAPGYDRPNLWKPWPCCTPFCWSSQILSSTVLYTLGPGLHWLFRHRVWRKLWN